MFSLQNHVISTFSIAITFHSLIVVTLAKRPRKTTTPTTTSPTPPPIPEYCSALQANLQIKDMEAFLTILNKEYNKLDSFPKNAEACYDTLDKMVYVCGINPIMYDDDAVKRNDSNLIIKIRYNERSCIALRRILTTIMKNETFEKLREGHKVTLMALGYSQGGDNAISEWIILFYEDGNISKAKQNNAQCLWNDEFKDLEYKGKRIADFFPREL